MRLSNQGLVSNETNPLRYILFIQLGNDSPNSCGQVQVADIGLMGCPARKEIDGKKVAVPGCKIFVGGKIGEESHLSLEPIKTGIPIDEEDLIPELIEILKSEFGAVEK